MYIFDVTNDYEVEIFKLNEIQMIQQMLARQHKIVITRDWMKVTLNRYIDYSKCFSNFEHFSLSVLNKM